MAPGLNRYRRTGELGGDHPSGLNRVVYALLGLCLAERGTFARISIDE